MRVVALLDSMWGGVQYEGRKAPRWFRINPYNFSGRRLYKLVGPEVDLLVTNCCPVMQQSARNHGKPDAAWVAENLARLEPFGLLLVCGNVARLTYDASGYAGKAPVMYTLHPAARTWTKDDLKSTAEEITKCTASR